MKGTKEIYLDNSATTRVHPEVLSSMSEAMTKEYGNPSSLHRKGIEAESLLRRSREILAKALGVDPQGIVFTSGGTEANNLAIRGVASAYRSRGSHIITSAIEHPSVLNLCRELEEEGFELTYVQPNGEGVISVADVSKEIRKDTILISIMHVNNEIGSVQPIEEIGELVRRIRGDGLAGPEPGGDVRLPVFHVDAVQSFLRMPLNPNRTGLDLLTLSAHKIHGPKGVGALYVRPGIRLKPIVYGGEQERGVRSGTENVPGIAGFGKAVEIFSPQFTRIAREVRELKEKFAGFVLSELPDVTVNGSTGERSAPHILNLSFPWVRGETLVHHLEEYGVYVSSGSACTSRDPKPSHVLKAMKLERRRIEGAIRISLGFLNDAEEIDAASRILVRVATDLRKLFHMQDKRRGPRR